MYRRLTRFIQRYRKVEIRSLVFSNSVFAKLHTATPTYCRSKENVKLKFDYDYLCDPQNLRHIENLISCRKGIGNIRKVVEVHAKLKKCPKDTRERHLLELELEKEASMIPNKASPHLFQYGEEPKLIELVNKKREYNFKPREILEIGQDLDILRTENLGLLNGSRSYFFRGALANLEQALLRYTISHLSKQGFILMSVPDLLYSNIIESCGMNTKGQHTQVYRIEGSEDDVCLSGTAEMAFGGYLQNKEFLLQNLPLKMAAISRCFRAESSSLHEERGIYRVHGFTKVEMFGVTSAESGNESTELYAEIIQIQKELFTQLGIHFQILEMPLHDLGAPAYSKIDMEAWMPGRNLYGEISSASNCTDYQSRRLNICYQDNKGEQRFVHTVNGTACAIPRMLIAICETFQSEDGTISIPSILQPYMSGLTTIKPPRFPCRMTWVKRKTYAGKIV